VPRGVEDPHVQAADAQLVAVAHPDPLEVDALVGREQVVGAVAAGEREGAGDVVVVDVGVRDGGDLHLRLLGGALHRGQVAGRVDDQRRGPVVDQVAAVAELGHVQRDHLHGFLRQYD
jgi:hypothetical protein